MNRKTIKVFFTLLALIAAGIMAGCSTTAAKSPDVSDSIRKSLDQAGLKDVTVSQAKSFAGAQVVADQIAVIPVGGEKDAKAVNSDLDNGIEQNLDAALIQNQMHDNVKYKVKSGVVTLSGEVNSENKRTRAQQVASGVPNVLQVVNDLQVKNQKASSSPSP